MRLSFLWILIPLVFGGWSWGSGYNEGDLEIQQYKIVGDIDEGIKFDPDNDGDVEVTMNADGSLTISNYTLPYEDGDDGEVLTTDGMGTVTWEAGGGGGASPLTTKGDLYTYDTDDARLPVGTDTYLLSADSAETTGLKWIDPATVGTTTYLGLTDTPSSFTASAIPYTNAGATALAHSANWIFNGTSTVTLDAGGMVNSVFNINGSTDSYIRSTATDLFQIGHNGNITTINSSGNVGLGDASPTYKLDVNGDLRTVNGAILASTSGNVGIGTTSPGQLLDIDGKFWFDATNSQFTTQPYTTTDSGSGSGGQSNGSYLDVDCSSAGDMTALKVGTGQTFTQQTFDSRSTYKYVVTASSGNDLSFAWTTTAYTTGDFTASDVIYIDSGDTVSSTSSANGYYIQMYVSSTMAIQVFFGRGGVYSQTGSTTFVEESATAIDLQTWTEVAIEYDGSGFDILVDGTVLVSGSTNTRTLSGLTAGTVYYGANIQNSNTALTCYSDAIKAGDGMTSAGFLPLVNTSTDYGSGIDAPIGSAYHATYINPTNDHLGNREVANNLYVLGNGQIDGEIQVDDDALVSVSGNIGIGTDTPSATLDVVGTVQFETGTPAVDDILTATDTDGNATWKTATMPQPICLSAYDAEPARTSVSDIHGGISSLATGQPLNSTPTDIVVTKGIGKVFVVINAGSDVAGDITITGTSVDRETGATTGSDTDTLTVNAITTDGSDTDGNGNTRYSFTGGYVSSKWFVGSVTLSTTDLTLTDVDVYHVSYEQFNDSPNITLQTFDVNLITTNASAQFDAYLYTLERTGDKCDITRVASVNVGTDGITALANKYERLRRGNLAIALDGSTDGIWASLHYANSPAYIEDVTVKMWADKECPLTFD